MTEMTSTQPVAIPQSPAPRPRSLPAWLEYLECLHPKTIELGLERCSTVKERLRLDMDFLVITVGGTNGKGSTCAFLEAVLGAADYRIGCYTSPHLLRYNERVRVAARAADDDALCRAFEAVEAARGEISLSYFEFGTLAAMWLFARAGLDVVILEVGLGGRLDAVNMFDADCAIVTSIDLDHMDYLGDNRESIGLEKAGIFRVGRPAICGDADPPQSLLQHVDRIGADLKRIGRDFSATVRDGEWLFRGMEWRMALPRPTLRGACQFANAAACLAALECLRSRLPVTPENIRRGLLDARVPGRFEVRPGNPVLILDVAHNPQAARGLAANLEEMHCGGRTIAVFAMLADKDIPGVIDALRGVVDLWLVAGIAHARGGGADELATCLMKAGIRAVKTFPGIAAAYFHACQIAGEDDRIAAFGSFHTVAEVMQEARNRNPD